MGKYVTEGTFERLCNYYDKFGGPQAVEEFGEAKRNKIEEKGERISFIGLGREGLSNLHSFANLYAKAELETRKKPEMRKWYFTFHFIPNMLVYRIN